MEEEIKEEEMKIEWKFVKDLFINLNSIKI